MKKFAVTLFIIALAGLVLIGCQKDKTQGLYNPNESYLPNPVVSSVAPDSALAGVTIMTITGENFSADPSQNVVYFKSPDIVLQAKILSSTATKIELVPPVLYNDSTTIKVSVRGALLFDTYGPYKLKPAVQPINLSTDTDVSAFTAQGVAIDKYENAFVLQRNVSLQYAFKKVDRDLNVSKLRDTYFSSFGLVAGPRDTLYATAALGRAKQVVQFPPDGSASQVFTAGLSKVPSDLDFDQNGNIWVAADDEIDVVTSDGTVTPVSQFQDMTLSRIRVFDGAVYALGHSADYSTQQIWKSEIQGTNLGTSEVYFDLASNTWLSSSDTLNAFEFAANSDLYIATSIDTDGVFVVHPSGDHEVVYPGLFNHPISALTWGNYSYIYGIEVSGSLSYLLKINLLQDGAVHWGRTF